MLSQVPGLPEASTLRLGSLEACSRHRPISQLTACSKKSGSAHKCKAVSTSSARRPRCLNQGSCQRGRHWAAQPVTPGWLANLLPSGVGTPSQSLSSAMPSTPMVVPVVLFGKPSDPGRTAHHLLSDKERLAHTWCGHYGTYALQPTGWPSLPPAASMSSSL